MKSQSLPLKWLVCITILTAIQGLEADINGLAAVDLTAAHPRDGEEETTSMESLLHWAISESDPKELRKHAEAVQAAETAQEYAKKRERVTELYHFMEQQTTETTILQHMIAVIANTSAPEDDVLLALSVMAELVEPVDNANDLKSLEGIPPLLALLSGSPAIQIAACLVLGTAAANNPTFQRHVLQTDVGFFGPLLQITASASDDLAYKGVYAVSALIRNSHELRAAFRDAGGLRVLAEVLTRVSSSERLRVRVAVLGADLVLLEEGYVDEELLRGVCRASVTLLTSSDALTREKALAAMQQLKEARRGGRLLVELGAVAALEAESQRANISDDEALPDGGHESDASLLAQGLIQWLSGEGRHDEL